MTPRSSERPDDGEGRRGKRNANEAESRQIIARLHRRDPDAFEFLYERHFSRIFGYVCTLVTDSADAEDITHHVFEQMLTAAGRGHLRNVRSLRHWLFAVARNRAVDFLRTQSRVDLNAPGELSERLTSMQSESTASEPTWSFSDPELVAALRRLARREREVILLRYIEDFDLAEIAATIGSTESSVQNAHSRALRSLRELLDWS